MLQLSEFVWSLRSSAWVVFNNFLLIDTTDRSKNSSNQKRLFCAVSLYPLSFFANTPFKGLSCKSSITVWRVKSLKFSWTILSSITKNFPLTLAFCSFLEISHHHFKLNVLVRRRAIIFYKRWGKCMDERFHIWYFCNYYFKNEMPKLKAFIFCLYPAGLYKMYKNTIKFLVTWSVKINIFIWGGGYGLSQPYLILFIFFFLQDLTPHDTLKKFYLKSI